MQREKIKTIFLKAHFTAIGLFVLLLGLLFIASVWVLSIPLAQFNCQGGMGPVPNQGCGYVPYLVLFVWGENTTLLEGTALALLGLVILLFRLFLLGLRFSIGTILILGVVVLVVVSAAGSVYSSSEISQQLGPLSGTEYLAQCPTSWPPQRPGPNITQLETLVAMTINPNTTGKICILYNSESNNGPVSATLNGTVYYASNMTNVPSQLVSVNVEPKSLELPSLEGIGLGEPYAVFTLNVSYLAKGFYMLSLSGICSAMPLAVGYEQINYTDFAYALHHENQCSSNLFTGSYVSVDNIGVAFSYIPLNGQ